MFREDKPGSISLVTGTEAIIYIADNLPNPRLIGYKELEKALTISGYNVFSKDVKRDHRLKNDEFLVYSTSYYLNARNRGWGISIDVREEPLGNDRGWQIKITGKPKNKSKIERIVKAL